MSTQMYPTRPSRSQSACIALAAALAWALTACAPSAHSAKLPQAATAHAEAPAGEASAPLAAPVSYFGEQYEEAQRGLNSKPAEPPPASF